MAEVEDPVVIRHRDLEQIALTSLEAGRLLMETGARCAVVREGMERVALALGAESVYMRVGYASLTITVTRGPLASTRMLGCGAKGVHMRLNHAIRDFCVRVAEEGMSCAEASAGMAKLAREVPHYSKTFNVISAGVACAAFGRLLGIDWLAVLPVLGGSIIGQTVRHAMASKGINAFVQTAFVGFIAALLCGLSAILSGSQMIDTAMGAAVLMLVPGVPAMNAQTDIMEGFPTLGSARFVSVFMIILFMTVGVGAAHLVIGGGHPDLLKPHNTVLHQAIFGAIAAAGFGVLFNFGRMNLVWAGLAGAVALTVRTIILNFGWPLEAASFVAAIAVALCVEVLQFAPGPMRRSGNVLAVAGCIPMIPGSAAAHWIIALLELTTVRPDNPELSMLVVMTSGLQVIFTIGAIGAGITIVASLLRRPDFRD